MQKKLGTLKGLEVTQQQKQFKVLLIGDSCIDRYVYGVVDRISPEAPVPVLKWEREETTGGMAWNVYYNLLSFGINVSIITNEEKPIKTRYVDLKSNQQIMRLDEKDEVSDFGYALPDNEYDALVISDYNKGFISSEMLNRLVNWFDGPVFVDTKKPMVPPAKAFIKINEYEHAKVGETTDKMIITRGSKGAEYQGKLYPGVKVNTFDVCGAGDTFLSALVYYYLIHDKIEKAIPFANRAAAIAVQNQGTYILSQRDINELAPDIIC